MEMLDTCGPEGLVPEKFSLELSPKNNRFYSDAFQTIFHKGFFTVTILQYPFLKQFTL